MLDWLFGYLGFVDLLFVATKSGDFVELGWMVVIFATNYTNFHKFFLGCIKIHPYLYIIPMGLCLLECCFISREGAKIHSFLERG